MEQAEISWNCMAVEPLFRQKVEAIEHLNDPEIIIKELLAFYSQLDTPDPRTESKASSLSEAK